MKLPLLYYTWILVQLIIGYNLVFPFLQFCLFLLFRKNKQAKKTAQAREADYAIIVTAYEQTHTIPAAVASLLKLNYSNYIIYVVADKCDVSHLHFTDERVVILRPEQTLGSNTRSHFYAIDHFKRAHDRLTIIDSDNLADPQYLNELNTCFEKGYSAVQGTRKAKNTDTVFSSLDAARDMYYHFYDGEVLFEIGSSATLAGSGMAFTVDLYKRCLEQLDITGAGFDKVLQYEIVDRGYQIAFAKNAIVYDEKTSRSDQLVKQRARWINTWFRYFNFGFKLIGSGIISRNWNQFLFGFVLLRPPLFLFIIFSGMFMITNMWLSPVATLIWLCGFLFFIAGFFIAIAHSNPDKRIYRSFLSIPRFMFLQVLSLLKVRRANNYSVATNHYYNQNIEEIEN